MKIAFAEFNSGALIGRRIVVTINTIVPIAVAQMLKRLTHLVGMQMMRYDANIIAR